jgi:hypothetical protein
VPSRNPSSRQRVHRRFLCLGELLPRHRRPSHGYNFTLVESWTGKAWSIVSSPNPVTFQNVLHGVLRLGQLAHRRRVS